MKRVILIQLQYEIASWKRLLDFIINENIYFKIQLSVVLKGKIDHHMLEEAEKLQNCFIREDEIAGLLRNEIADFEQLMNRDGHENSYSNDKLDQHLLHLRQSINLMEKQFEELRSAFISYLSENVKYG